MAAFCPLPSGRDCIDGVMNWKSFVEELRQQWKLMWMERIDDKVRAEGIARQDFKWLFVDRGTVIIATRCYKQLEFKGILEEYEAPYEVRIEQEQPSPHVGGWRKFGKGIAARRRAENDKRHRLLRGELEHKKKRQQLKKGGRGWLHIGVK